MYQALYRKWRPRSFDDVVGQSHITETLKNQVRTDRLSHAYLFVGTRGTGKTTCAKILAKAVNCEHPVNGNPCNECSICRGIDDGSIMDVVEMDTASNNGVDNVRQLRDEAVFSPATAKKRVYIVDEVHMLSVPAFNALLKILEEPPAHLMFILATTELNKVPATILSRCQRHSFKRLDSSAIVGRLQYVAQQESIDLTPEAAELIAGLSEGGMRDALSMLDQCSGREKIDIETVYSALGLASRKSVGELLEHIAGNDSAAAITLFETLWQDGKDPATLLGELSTLLRDLLMRAVAPKGGSALLSGNYDSVMLDRFKNALSAEVLVNDLNILQSALFDLRTGQARTIAELCLIKLCEPGLSDTLPMLRERVARLEQAVSSGAVVPAAPSANPKPKAVPPEAAAAEPQKPTPEEDSYPPFPEEAPPLPEDPPPWLDEPCDSVPEAPNQPAPPSPEPVQIPQPVPEASLEPAAAPASPCASDAALWDRVRDALPGQFPPGLLAILSDPAQVGASLSGDTLLLTLRSDFAKNMVDRPEVTAKLSAIASQQHGAPVQVRFGQEEAAVQTAASESKLDALKAFPDIVKFK